MQAVGYEAHVIVGQSGNAVLIVRQKLANLLFLHRRVVVVVRLISLQQRVFLLLDGLVGLVDGEVELGDERSVHPRLSDVVAELLAFVSRQRPYDEENGD